MQNRKFNFQYDTQQAAASIQVTLDGARRLYDRLRHGVGVSDQTGARIAACFFSPIHNQLAEEIIRFTPDDEAKRLYSDYLKAHAYYLGMEGRIQEGQELFRKARRVMRGGWWEERCQDYYHGDV